MLDLVYIDRSRFKDATRAYFLWKELNGFIKNSHSRGLNFPEAISETMACYALDFALNRGSGGDAVNPDTDEIIEFKATSNWDRDTTSFSPHAHFDHLYFIRLDQREDELYIYDLEINSEQLKDIQVSRAQTLGDQQLQGRRPRFSVINKIIEEYDYQPVIGIDIRRERILT